MSTSEQRPDEPEVREQLASVGHFLRKALRFWPQLLATLAIGGVAFAVFLHFHQPRFRSETVILYVEKGDTTQEVESSDTERSVTVRLKELLFARPNLERVVQRFGLYPELRRNYGMVDAVEELKKHVEFRAPGGDTFSIAFEGKSASEAQTVTQELARLVIEGDAELRKKSSRVALDFLAGERQTRDAELKQAEEQLAGFMAQHPRFALDATPLANGAAIRASLGGAPVAGQGRIWTPPRPTSAAPAPVSAGTSPPTPAPTGKPGDSEESRARAALAAARETLTQKLEHYTPAHPDVRAAEAAVQRATERLAAVSAAAPAATPAAPAIAATPPAPVASGAPSPRPAAVAMRSSPPVATASPAARNEALVELETDWLKLTRAVTEARQRLDQIESQLFRADIEVNSERGGHAVQVNVIDPAFLPQRPVPPGTATWGLIFLAATFVVGALLMIVRATLDDRVFDARDVGAGLEVLAEVPRSIGRRRYAAS